MTNGTDSNKENLAGNSITIDGGFVGRRSLLAPFDQSKPGMNSFGQKILLVYN